MSKQYPNQVQWDNRPDNAAPEGNYKFRPGRGYVHQSGMPPTISSATGQNQGQRNAAPVNWADTFNSTHVPEAPAAPVGPQTPAQAFRQTFAANGQPPRGVTPPQPAAVSPPAPAIAKAPPVNPASQTVNVPHGTITPMHTWQQTITAQYPEIGKAGSPQNRAFVQAYQQHGDPNKAMKTAHRIMGGLDTATGAPLPGMGTPQRIDPYALN